MQDAREIMKARALHHYVASLKPEEREAFLAAMSRPWSEWSRLIYYGMLLSVAGFVLLVLALF